MAIYQPSNITPSSFAGGGNGVVSASDPVVITWQVNGNSLLKAFKIDFYQNDAASTPVYSTDVLNVGCPFNGKDNKGNFVPFVYSPGISWSTFGLVNGQSYKMRIWQYWGEETNDPEDPDTLTFEYSVGQQSASAFITRSYPLLLLNYTAIISTVVYTFTATYEQAEGDSIDWCRWQLSQINADGNKTVLTDTGEINTSVLSFTVDGLLSGNNYSVHCQVQTSSGVLISTERDLSVFYDQINPIGSILSATAMNDSSVLININTKSLPPIGVSSPSRNYGEYTEDSLILYEGSSITWNENGSGAIQKEQPYSVGWVGDVTGAEEIASISTGAGTITCASFTPDHSYLVVSKNPNIGGDVLEVYQMGETPYLLNTVTLSSIGVGLVLPSLISFHSSGSYLAVGGSSYTVGAYLLSFNKGTIALVSKITSNDVSDLRFSPTGDLLCVCTGLNGTKLYALNESSGALTQLSSPTYNGSVIQSSSADFSTDGTRLAVGFLSADSTLAVDFTISESEGSYTLTQSLVFQKNYGSNQSVEIIRYVPDSPDDQISYTRYYLRASYDGGIAYEYVGYNGDAMTYSEAPPVSYTPVLLLGLTSPNLYGVNAQDTSGVSISMWSGDPLMQDKSFTLSQTGRILSGYKYTVPTELGGFDEYQMLVINDASGTPSLHFIRRKINATMVLEGLEGNTSHFRLNFYDSYLTVFCSMMDRPSYVKLQGATAAVSFTQDEAIITFFDGTTTNEETVSYDTLDSSINQLSIYGYQECKFLSVMSGTVDFTDYEQYAENNLVLFDQYFTLYLYRRNENALKKILSLESGITSFKDFGAKSNSCYFYEVIGTREGEESFFVESENPIGSRFTSYYLLEASPDPNDPNLYHVVRSWRFGNNISAGSVSNNNTPTFLTNFTPYRLRQPVSLKGKSGTLQALLGNTVKGNYNDYTEEMEALYGLSTTSNTLFLKDMKGNLYMVHTAAPIVQTINTATDKQEVTISIPWEEVGDAENVSLIQLPTDPGWTKDQVNLARFDVNADNGIATVSYPNGYTGTTFRIFGNNLFAITPDGLPAPDLSINANGEVIYE